jgi:fructose-bisphosphate aldolase class II
MHDTAEIIKNAHQAGIAIPAFNVPCLAMIEPVIQAVADQDCFALVEVARLEWTKFESQSPAAVREEFVKWNQPDFVRLHLDHIPVIDEDNQRVDYLSIIREAIELGYDSVMVDGSRLDLEENIEATRQVVDVAHAAGIPCEAELGAVLGHEAGPLPPYDELFESGMGFTDVQEARRFVRETGCDWLSVAIGNIHGAISGAMKDRKKVGARLDLEHLERLRRATGIPLVLHGGSGVKREHVLAAIKKGITKVNVGTEIRQAYQSALRASGSVAAAQDAVYERTSWLIRDYFGLSRTRALVMSQETGPSREGAA